jgi:hypothetical protein
VPGVRAAVAVDDEVVEAAGARTAEIRGGREGDGAGGDVHRAARRVRDVDDGEGVAVAVGVVAGEVATRDDGVRVLGCRDRVVVRDGRDVELAVDVDGDVARVGAPLPSSMV